MTKRVRQRLPADSNFPKRTAAIFHVVRMASLLLSFLIVAGCGKPAGPTPGGAGAGAANRSANATTANTSSNAITTPSTLQKAIFEDRPETGRDPFFPRSSRRRQAVAQSQGEAQKPKLPLSSYLKLTGLVLSKSGPSAWINGTMFSAGERSTVKVAFTNSQNSVELQDVQVRCVEIRKSSVLISVEGESGLKELRVP